MNSISISSRKSLLLRGGSILLLALGLVVSTNSILAAPADDKPDPRPSPGDRMKHMVEELGLTEAQKGQIKGIMESQRAKMEALREDETTPRTEKRAKMQAMRDEIQKSIRAVLTPEQQAKFDAMPRPDPRQGRPAGGKRDKQD
ncbi:MAG: Spy/CpxP family protein refolding chaperone [Cephaloticoccus sp.]|nr:Spy/CpxP family protein refolding chaperone [Cephaloticoccus sp.]MCF7761234.1 Spy/CpxP family protein refolding chaperone [Cephaloticoccus sp.]